MQRPTAGTQAPSSPTPSPGPVRALARALLALACDRLSLASTPVVVARDPGVHVHLPRSVDDVDAAFLGRLLGRRVDGIARLDGSAGTTDRVRLALRGDGVPGSVFLKMAPRALGARLFGGLAGLGENEVGFYRDVRPALAIEAPAALGLAWDPRTGRFVLALEDLEARGARLADLRAPYGPEEAGALLETLAALHGPFHASPRLESAGDLAWLRANGSDPLLPVVAWLLPALARRVARREPGLVPAAGRPILARYRAVARALDAGVHTVLHGDPHPGNVYFVDGRAGLFDWQVVRRGHPLRDVTYALVLGLEPGTRRAHERSLLERYAAALAAAGGPRLAGDEVWAAYRRMAAYPYVAATFTAGLGGLQEDAVARVGLVRAVAALHDLGTPAALREPETAAALG